MGQKRQYSNLAVGLLGETLSIIENIPYKELVAEKILQPLQLKSTYFEIPQAEKPNFAQGYKNGEATSEWTFQAMAGAGALRMNVKDLLKYGKSYLYSSPLDEAQRLVTKTHYKSDEGVEMGLGWFKNRGTSLPTSWGLPSTAGFPPPPWPVSSSPQAVKSSKQDMDKRR